MAQQRKRGRSAEPGTWNLEPGTWKESCNHSTTEMSLEPGSRLGPYEIRTLLGVGGMGEVYRGRDTRLRRDVALKVISPKFIGNSESRDRFQREAMAASALNHPAIVTIYDVGDTEGVSWIAMEWVDGRTLRSVLADAPLELQATVTLARQIADGLAAAHDKGVVHRDLKPENVMLSSDGRVRILDFGLARQGDPGLGSAATNDATLAFDATIEGAILGTVGYMSPEQAAGAAADFRSDQFAFGVVLYEMLTGRRAVLRPTAVETMSATIRDEPQSLSAIRSGIPDVLERVVTRCLAKKPEDRFHSTRDLVAALDVISARLNDPPGPAPTIVLPLESPVRASPRLGRYSRMAFAVTGIAALALTLGALTWKVLLSPAPAIDSLAVLPFENRSTDPGSSYLGDELAESLINQMSRLPSLTVMARATTFRFKSGTDPRQVGRELGVGAVLTGSVNRRAGQLTISTALIDSSTGAHIWGETYDRPFSELLHVQDEIAAQISERLKLRLTPPERRMLGGQGTNSADAYELFLKAQHELLDDSEEGDLRARGLYLQALDKDPQFVDARLGVASTYARAAGNGYASPHESWAKVDEHLGKAKRIDPGNFSVRASEAARRFLFEWDWPGAEREFSTVSEDPRIFYGNRYHPAAIFFWARGWPDRAVSLIERALKVDPGNLESRIMLANVLSHSGHLDDAATYFRAIAAVAPSDPRPLFGLSEVLRRKRDISGAIVTLRKAYELAEEEDGIRALNDARTERDYHDAAMAVAGGRLKLLQELATDRYISPLDLARLSAQTGRRDQAFAYLERAIVERSPMVVALKVDAAWDDIRDDPRFAAIVRRLGIP